MASNYSKSLYNQYEELLIKFEAQEKLLKGTNNLVTSLNDNIKPLNKTIEQLKKTNEEQAKEILRLKSKNDKDSSNSSKPSELMVIRK